MPTSNTLSDKVVQAAIKSAKAADKPSTISDGGGLSLICRPDGGGWWRLRYWILSKENRLSLGTYPEISLADARKRRDDARKLIANGVDPSDDRKATKLARLETAKARALEATGLPGPNTFEYVARDWLKTVHELKVSEGHAQRTRIRLEQDVFPWLGRRRIAEIESPELLECLRRIEARGAIETAHRVKDSCGWPLSPTLFMNRSIHSSFRDPPDDLEHDGYVADYGEHGIDELGCPSFDADQERGISLVVDAVGRNRPDTRNGQEGSTQLLLDQGKSLSFVHRLLQGIQRIDPLSHSVEADANGASRGASAHHQI